MFLSEHSLSMRYVFNIVQCQNLSIDFVNIYFTPKLITKYDEFIFAKSQGVMNTSSYTC